MIKTHNVKASEKAMIKPETQEIITNNDHGITDDQAIFEAYLDNCDPKLFGPSLCKGNDFSTFFDNDGWGNG